MLCTALQMRKETELAAEELASAHAALEQAAAAQEEADAAARNRSLRPALDALLRGGHSIVALADVS